MLVLQGSWERWSELLDLVFAVTDTILDLFNDLWQIVSDVLVENLGKLFGKTSSTKVRLGHSSINWVVGEPLLL